MEAVVIADAATPVVDVTVAIAGIANVTVFVALHIHGFTIYAALQF